MKTYISVASLLIVGILAVATTIFLVFPTQQSLNTTTTTFTPQGQSAIITSTTSLGDVKITEILVNTSIQFPVGNRTILPSSLMNSVQVFALIVLLCLSILIIEFSLSRHP